MNILKKSAIASLLLILARHPDGTVTIQLTDGGPAYVRPFIEEIGYPGAEEIQAAWRGSTVKISVLEGGSPNEWVRFIASLPA